MSAIALIRCAILTYLTPRMAPPVRLARADAVAGPAGIVAAAYVLAGSPRTTG